MLRMQWRVWSVVGCSAILLAACGTPASQPSPTTAPVKPSATTAPAAPTVAATAAPAAKPTAETKPAASKSGLVGEGESLSLDALYEKAKAEGGAIAFYGGGNVIPVLGPIFEARFPGLKIEHIDA